MNIETAILDAIRSAKQDTLDTAYRAVDACGGTMPEKTAVERAYRDGYNQALDNALNAIAAMGGMDPILRKTK